MTLTNEQWTQQLAASEDPASLYPDAPAFDLPEGAQADYEAADAEQYDDEYGDEDDEYGSDGEPFDDYADPDEDGQQGPPRDLVDVPLDSDEPDEPQRPRRFDGKVAMGFAAAGLVAVLVAIVGAVAVYGSEKPDRPTAASVTDPGAAPPPRTATPKPVAAESTDRPLLYSADAAGSCAAGSTSAQTMAGSDPHSAFVCVRGGADGQVIEIDLSKTYMITAISLTPGWVGKDASGASQWEQYRVVTTVQYLFNDTDRTLVTQETKNVHGEAVQPIKRVLASKIKILIRQTSRPPAQPEPGTPPTPTPGGVNLPAPPLTLAPLPGSPLGGQPESDPVDAAFAIKRLKIIGHEPL
ncbi:hypothetical protein [Mycobacterium sp. IDR2000157661]|uniref:hypothetical protein n=1 Tax=Mycobacterium sp. IDR2000157661 TaxID=2867005 RepID=UPI001EEB17E3|nr:hypothetical protein [Mycobacterium sp. IDR2000157661]ULE31181.1 hypothetical protein K3G64_00400 [Mycobacterium sp. IDR2000157661]